MDERVRAASRAPRWLAWASAGLLTAGAVSAGAVTAGDGGSDRRIVSTAGRTTGAVEEGPTIISQPAPLAPAPVVPPSTPALPPTTAPKPTVTAPPTTRPAQPTTTRPATPATTATTARAAAPGRRPTLTIVNEYSHEVVVTVNGRRFALRVGHQAGPFELALVPNGNDVIEVTVAQRPSCGLGDAGGFFQPGGTYRLSVYAIPTNCDDLPAPQMRVTPA